MANKKVSVGVIGCGTVSRSHLLAYMRIPNVEVVAVSDVVEERAKEAKQLVGAERAYKNYSSILRRSDIDMVDICLPNFLHARVAIDSAEAGKHVLVEKPMATNLKQADAMIDAAQKAKVKLMVGQTRRFSPLSQKIKQIVDSGWIGTLFYIRILMGHGGPGRPGDPGWRGGGRLWFLESEKSGGGCLLDIGIHLADFMRYIGGEVSSVFAVTDTFRKERKIMDTTLKNLGVDDHSIMTLRFSSGAVGHFSAAWVYLPGVGKQEIFGSEGSILTDVRAHPLAVYSLSRKIPTNRRERWFYPTLKKESAFVRMIEHFVRCIREDMEPMVNGTEGRRSLEVIMAAYESVRSRSPVRLPFVKD